MSNYFCVHMSEIHERLLEERERLDLNQEQFAELGGVKRRAQVNYEAGERFPDGRYYAGIAAAGADVQYILTGIKSANALAPDELLLLERYRSSPQVIKTAALQVLLAGEQSGSKTIINGNVGQNMSAPMNGGTITVNMRDKK